MHLEGNLVNVFTEEIYPARVSIKNDKIVEIKELKKNLSKYILPGFIDSHVHIESSMLCPSRFAEAVIPHGTTCIITDPHEIANVLGVQGIEYLREDSLKSPLRVFFTAPSCVPATIFETSGAKLGVKEIERLLKRDWIIGLGEVMDYNGVINENTEILQKINIAKKMKKKIDGHAPLLNGLNLCKYISFGIDSDHECTSYKEALEKVKLGMKLMIRQGSATKNLKSLIKIAKISDCLMVTDDIHPNELIKGHLDILIKDAISHGIDPIKAIKMVTLNPSNHYNLNIGAISPGRKADIVIVNNLKSLNIEKVLIDGNLVINNGKTFFSTKPLNLEYKFNIKKKKAEDFIIECKNEEHVKVNIIEIVKDQIFTKKSTGILNVENNQIKPDIKKDILKIVVVERYGGDGIGKGFIHGFSIKNGAIASSVSHDSHNIVAVGSNDEDIAKAVNLTSKHGGFSFVGKNTFNLPLPIAGLISTEKLDIVVDKLKKINTLTKEMGCKMSSPFISLSFMTLLVIPELKISDKGLFDSKNFEFVSIFSEKNIEKTKRFNIDGSNK